MCTRRIPVEHIFMHYSDSFCKGKNEKRNVFVVKWKLWAQFEKRKLFPTKYTFGANFIKVFLSRFELWHPKN